jgi:hypothetical protein
MSHAKRGGATHTRVMPIKIKWLILSTKRYDGTIRIDVVANVHMELSHDRGFVVTLLKITSSALV